MLKKILHYLKILTLLAALVLTLLWLAKTLNPDTGIYPDFIRTILDKIPDDIFEPLSAVLSVIVSLFSIEFLQSRFTQAKEAKEVSENLSKHFGLSSDQKILTDFGINNLIDFGTINKNFLGRATLLKTIEDNFLNQNKKIQVLQGIDGIGKTQLAFEYAFSKEKEGKYSNAIWVIAGHNAVIFEENLGQLADAITHTEQAKNNWSSEEKLKYLFAWLRKKDDWLIIIDDLNDPAIVQKFLIGISGNIIITSSSPDWTTTLDESEVLIVPPLKTAEAIKVLKHTSKNNLSKSDVSKIAKRLGNIPILLHIVGAYYAKGAYDDPDSESTSAVNVEEDNKTIFKNNIAPIWEEIYDFKSKFAILNFSKLWGISCTLNILLFSDHQRIPRYLLIDHLKNSTFYSDPKSTKGFKKVLFKIFNNNRIYKKALRKQNTIINAMINSSIITISRDGHLNINKAIQDVLFSFWIQSMTKYKFQKAGLNVFFEEFYSLFKYAKPASRKKEILPHAAAVIEKLNAHKLPYKNAIKLAKSVSDHLQDNWRFKSAAFFSQYAYDLEKELKGVASVETIKGHILNAVQGQSNTALQVLAKELDQKGNTNSSYEKVVIGFKDLATFKHESAAKNFGAAIELAELNASENTFDLPTLYIFCSLALSQFDQEKCLIHLEKWKTLINKPKENESPALDLLVLEGDVYLNLALQKKGDDFREENYHFADLANQKFEEVLTLGKEEDAMLIYTSQIERCLMAFFMDDQDQLIDSANYLKTNESNYFNIFKEMPLALGEYHLLQGVRAFVESDSTNGEKSIAKAKRFYAQVFDGNMPRIELANQILEHFST